MIMKSNWIVYTFLMVLIPWSGYAQENPGQGKILLRNVIMIDQSGAANDVQINILIDQGKLKLVSKDVIDQKEADLALDANGGFILGQLEAGNPATFILLDQDPRINVDVILDTEEYAVFAINQGEVVLNKLLKVDVDPNEQPSGWSAYAPPPTALPLSYQNLRKWNVIQTKPITFVFGGAIMFDNTRWPAQDAENVEQVDDLEEFEGGTIRGFRFGVGGSFNFKKPWTYLFTFGTNSFERGFISDELDEWLLYDYRLSIPIGKATLSLGKQKEPISISRLAALVHMPSQQERAAAADGLLPSRNVGIAFNGALENQRMNWAAGVFNNWYELNQKITETPTVVTARISGTPYMSEDESHLVHIGLAGRYSNAAGGIRYKARTEIYRGPFSVDTDDDLEDVKLSILLVAEMAWKRGPFILVSEYMHSNVRSSTLDNPKFKGYYVTASYVLTGEMHGFNKHSGVFKRVTPAKELDDRGPGAWEVYTRWSSFDLSDKEIDGGQMNTLSLGVNWWPFAFIQANASYRYTMLDRFDQKGTNHGVVTRLVFLLE